jgi:hypothetical protein
LFWVTRVGWRNARYETENVARRKVRELGKNKYNKNVKATCSASYFVPKPHTPFHFKVLLVRYDIVVNLFC